MIVEVLHKWNTYVVFKVDKSLTNEAKVKIEKYNGEQFELIQEITTFPATVPIFNLIAQTYIRFTSFNEEGQFITYYFYNFTPDNIPPRVFGIAKRISVDSIPFNFEIELPQNIVMVELVDVNIQNLNKEDFDFKIHESPEREELYLKYFENSANTAGSTGFLKDFGVNRIITNKLGENKLYCTIDNVNTVPAYFDIMLTLKTI